MLSKRTLISIPVASCISLVFLSISTKKSSDILYFFVEDSLDKSFREAIGDDPSFLGDFEIHVDSRHGYEDLYYLKVQTYEILGYRIVSNENKVRRSMESWASDVVSGDGSADSKPFLFLHEVNEVTPYVDDYSAEFQQILYKVSQSAKAE